ncbi:MAG TPA: fumarylacetoacetate hydrolase family protein [Enhygromyxa sp.]|nr:fumarylacetoacetate hydrolase family protein [Enhygromyxa sp.]
MTTTWLTRILADDRRPLTLRTRTDGEAPGPDASWEPIADPFVLASFDGGDPAALAGRAEPLAGSLRIADRRLLPPVASQKIIGIGRNYKAHAEELGNEVPTTPLTFFKPASCLLPSGDALELPRGYQRIDMEAELVVVIGRRARKIAAAQAWEHVAGYLLGNDVSCRDLQQSDKQWTRAKGFDGFGPVSPFVRLVEPGWPLPVEQLEIRGYLNDQRVQTGACELMIFSIPTLIEHLSACMTLEPGDLIFTGTPAGVSPLAPGDVVRVELGGLDLGRLVTPVV